MAKTETQRHPRQVTLFCKGRKGPFMITDITVHLKKIVKKQRHADTLAYGVKVGEFSTFLKINKSS